MLTVFFITQHGQDLALTVFVDNPSRAPYTTGDGSVAGPGRQVARFDQDIERNGSRNS